MNTSLSKFCKNRGLPKTTVYQRCRELNIDVSNGLTPASVARLEHEFDVVSQTQKIAPEVLPDNFIQKSELAPVEYHEMQLPPGFDPSAMVQLFDGVAGAATDTRSLLAIARLAINSVENAMDSKIAAQRLSLQQSENDAKKLEAEVLESKTRLQIKALESKMLAERQTSVTLSAEETFANLMEMGRSGKPES